MKKILLLLSSVVIFGSFNAQLATAQDLQSENPQSKETISAAEKQVLVPFSVQKKTVILEEAAPMEIAPMEIVPVKATTSSRTVGTVPVTSSSVAVASATTEVTKGTKTKVTLREIIKMRKALKANSTAPVRDGADILAVLGVIFGIAGAVVMFTSGVVGILLGIAGLAFGVIALQRVTGLKTLSTIGIILGAVVTVVATVLLLT